MIRTYTKAVQFLASQGIKLSLSAIKMARKRGTIDPKPWEEEYLLRWAKTGYKSPKPSGEASGSLCTDSFLVSANEDIKTLIDNMPSSSLPDELLRAKVYREKVEAERSKLKLDKENGKLILVSEIEKANLIFDQLIKNELLRIPTSCAPRLVGLGEPEIRNELQLVVNDILEAIYNG